MIDVERSAIAPASLARGTSWNDRDVLEALHRGFLGKCYLCERKLAIAKATAEELQRLHSGQDARSHRARFATRNLLDTIHDHYLERVHPLAFQVRRARKRGQVDADAEARLRAALSRRAPYTMLVRSMAYQGLQDLFD